MAGITVLLLLVLAQLLFAARRAWLRRREERRTRREASQDRPDGLISAVARAGRTEDPAGDDHRPASDTDGRADGDETDEDGAERRP